MRSGQACSDENSGAEGELQHTMRCAARSARTAPRYRFDFVGNGRHRHLLFSPETRASAVGSRRMDTSENFPRRHYPDRVRGYLLSPVMRSTPVSIDLIETLSAWHLQITRGVARRAVSRAACGISKMLTREMHPVCRACIGLNPGQMSFEWVTVRLCGCAACFFA